MLNGEKRFIAGLDARFAAPYPGLPRISFVRLGGDADATTATRVAPGRLGYERDRHPLDAYQTPFGDEPGNPETCSVGMPFSPRVLRALREKSMRESYHEAVRGEYLWHEFGDAHLLLPDR